MGTRTISDETKELAERLREPAPRLFGRSKYVERQIALLREIGSAGEPASILEIVPLLGDKKQKVAHHAASAIAELLNIVDPGDLLWLDQRVRCAWFYWREDASIEARRFRKQVIEKFANEPSVQLEIAALASFHPNGHIREAAVLKLGDQHDGRELPYLLIRLTDWVGKVRRLAERKVLERVVAHNIPRLVGVLEIIVALSGRYRSEQSKATLAIVELLSSRDARDHLLEALQAPRRPLRRAALDLLLAHHKADLASFVVHAQSNPDPVIRVRILKHAIGSEAVSETELRSFLRDKFPVVRALALEELLRRNPEDVRDLAVRALMDRASSVRRVAQDHLAETDGFDVADFYLEKLIENSNSVVRKAILGIGEVGSADLAQDVASFLDSDAPFLVRTAIDVLARLSGDEYNQRFLEHLPSEEPAVSNAARRALVHRVRRMGRAALEELYAEDLPHHVRKNLLVLVSRLPKWDSLPAILRYVADEDELASLAVALLWRWHETFNESQIAPSENQLRAARKSFLEVEGTLPKRLLREVGGLLSRGS